jgi:hypothetical protein
MISHSVRVGARLGVGRRVVSEVGDGRMGSVASRVEGEVGEEAGGRAGVGDEGVIVVEPAALQAESQTIHRQIQ